MFPRDTIIRGDCQLTYDSEVSGEHGGRDFAIISAMAHEL